MINSKIDLDIVNDKISKMTKIRKVAKSKLSKERGVSRDTRPENTIETLQDFLDANEQKWVYLKTIGPKLKKVIQQRFPNGKPMNGYTEKSWNTKKTKNDYHARPSDLEDIGGIRRLLRFLHMEQTWVYVILMWIHYIMIIGLRKFLRNIRIGNHCRM